MISTVVWGTGNVGRAAVRAVAAHPAPDLTAVPAADPAKVGRDAGELAGLDERLGVAATDDVGAVPAARPRAVVSAASGEIRPDAAPEDIARAVRSGAVVVTMDHHPPMLLESVPTAVWGGQVRMMARALGAELDEVTETVERRPLPATVVTAAMGEFRAGTQGAVREGARGARRSGSAGALGEGGAAV